MTTKPLIFRNKVSTLSPIDKIIKFDNPLLLSDTKNQYIQLKYAKITGLLPNIYSYDGWNNKNIKVSNDGGTTWTTITLRDGNYQIPDIKYAINTSISTWYTDVNDPAFTLFSNPVEQKAYITIDSTKLVGGVGQFAIDFGASDIYMTLGFQTINIYDTDGTFTASHIAEVDTHGYYMKINLDGFGDISLENNSNSNTIALCSLETSNNSYEITSERTCKASINTINRISDYKVSFVGSKDKKIVFINCDVFIIFEIMEI